MIVVVWNIEEKKGFLDGFPNEFFANSFLILSINRFLNNLQQFGWKTIASFLCSLSPISIKVSHEKRRSMIQINEMVCYIAKS
jgi:hypothetical protein